MHSEALKSQRREIRTSVPLARLASSRHSSLIKNQLISLSSIWGGFSFIDSGSWKSQGLCTTALEGQSHDCYLRRAFPRPELPLFSASVPRILTPFCFAAAALTTITGTGCNFALLTVHLPRLREHLLLSIFCSICHRSAVEVTVCMSKNRQQTEDGRRKANPVPFSDEDL